MAVRSLHGAGKTTIAALVVLWFATTRDGVTDWKAVTTAGSWRQLTKYLWPEIHKWSRLVDWDLMPIPPFGRNLSSLQLKLETGEAFAVASKDPGLIEGAHASSLLYILDEAKSIPPQIWDAVEGAFSNETEGNEAYQLAISTPGPPAGRLYEIFKYKDKYSDWAVFHITLNLAIQAGRVSKQWAENRKKQWGEKSAIYRRRVLGEFAEDEEGAVIHIDWIEKSNERWEQMAQNPPTKIIGLGVDTAGEGEDGDRTVITIARDKYFIDRPIILKAKSPMEITGRIVNILKGRKNAKDIPIIVDSIGIGGTGVISRLRELGFNAIGFNGAEGTNETDSSGELYFVNKRSAGYWRVREFLDPELGINLAIPPIPELIGELVSHTRQLTSTGKVYVESKDKVKSKIGRSPDLADSLMYALQAYHRKSEVGII